jgi:uncharacterized membrane protein YuzA (DUF378 family)
LQIGPAWTALFLGRQMWTTILSFCGLRWGLLGFFLRLTTITVLLTSASWVARILYRRVSPISADKCHCLEQFQICIKIMQTLWCVPFTSLLVSPYSCHSYLYYN